jgi:HPt (histidine-containing phosphotransfer) domain-containing protein
MQKPSIDAQTPAVDFNTLSELERDVAAGIPEIMIDLIDTFLRDSPKHINIMLTHDEGGDITTIQRSAHSMKSSCATFGAMPLANLCGEVEKLAREGRLDPLGPLMEQIQAEYERVQQILLAERKKYA